MIKLLFILTALVLFLLIIYLTKKSYDKQVMMHKDSYEYFEDKTKIFRGFVFDTALAFVITLSCFTIIF